MDSISTTLSPRSTVSLEQPASEDEITEGQKGTKHHEDKLSSAYGSDLNAESWRLILRPGTR